MLQTGFFGDLDETNTGFKFLGTGWRDQHCFVDILKCGQNNIGIVKVKLNLPCFLGLPTARKDFNLRPIS
ncbi:hypothetical protein EP01_09455 [Bdellovibrio bacteriovorus]|nr:hypothetical protein EP01_09455 [Bdellovibrio bacteriovorus]